MDKETKYYLRGLVLGLSAGALLTAVQLYDPVDYKVIRDVNKDGRKDVVVYGKYEDKPQIFLCQENSKCIEMSEIEKMEQEKIAAEFSELENKVR